MDKFLKDRDITRVDAWTSPRQMPFAYETETVDGYTIYILSKGCDNHVITGFDGNIYYYEDQFVEDLLDALKEEVCDGSTIEIDEELLELIDWDDFYAQEEEEE